MITLRSPDHVVVCDLGAPPGRQMRALGRTGCGDRAQARQTEPLTGRAAELEAANADLSARLIWGNSGNWSMPPSADDPPGRRLPEGKPRRKTSKRGAA